MNKIRLIARLDIKDDYVVKGIQLEGVRRVGVPQELAQEYYETGIDEILYVDNVASLYNRNSLDEVLYETTKKIFIPVTVGGGIRSVEDVRFLLSKGADKVAINTAAVKDETIITQVAEAFGSQCMVLSVQAKRTAGGNWEALYDNGREHSGKDVFEWIRRGVALGAGEILLTSVDCDGMMQGMDQELIEKACEVVNVPVIACGGVRNAQDIVKAAEMGVSAVAVGSALHFHKTTVRELKEDTLRAGGNVRQI
ncbi:MAG: imidazole glycerol phosphate synthase cyclase subunit [Muribaculum sp.]|nr:imidazole glycerol phosphate synthase cyclase subunit [Muribaculum sp.]